MFSDIMCGAHASTRGGRWRLCSRKTAPRWTSKMVNPQTDNYARQQARRDNRARRKNAGVARVGVEKMTDFRQQATEDASKGGVDGRSWLVPFTAWMRAGEAAWISYAKAWSSGDLGSEPPLEP